MYEPIKPARTLGAWKYTVIREVEDSDFAFEANRQAMISHIISKWGWGGRLSAGCS